MIYLLISSIIAMLLIVCSYTLGIKNTLKIIKKEEIENPFKVNVFNNDNDDIDEEIKKYNTLLENVNNYEPRGLKQKDV